MVGLKLKYPTFKPRMRTESGRPYIFDFVRRKWLALTPEEWVRQHVLNFLVQVKKYPASVISIEKELVLNDLKKRYDIVIYDRGLKPYLIVECKAPYIALNRSVLDQALRYNLIIKAPLLMISNGMSDLVFNSRNEVIDLPAYGEITP
jgi:hypothetical protein